MMSLLYVRYVQLAKTVEQVELGNQVNLLYQDYRDLGESLMNSKDAQELLFATVAENFVQIDDIMDEGIQANIDPNGPDGPEKGLVAANMETDVAEVGTWLGNYLRTPEERYKERILITFATPRMSSLDSIASV